MKKIITILFVFISISATLFAQESDTLKVDISIYKFIKIGDKVYKINYSLEEVKPENSLGTFRLGGGSMTVPSYPYLPYYPTDSLGARNIYLKGL